MAAKARPYKAFLSPFLHRQFGNVMGLTLVLCYGEALWMGQLNSWVWIWFWAGMRALLLFISYLFVLCLCMAHAHTGERTSPSELQTFWKYLRSFNTVSTFMCYASSAFFYTVVYIWSQPGKANLGMVDQGKPYERSKLNERPLYLYVMFLQLAAVQTVVHLYRDYGRLHLPFTSPAVAGDSPAPPSRRLALKKSLLPMVHDTLTRVGCFLFLANVTYFLFFRKLSWRVGYPIAKIRDGSIPNARPRPGFNPFELTGRLAIEGSLLVYLWEFANTAMTIYLSREPVKKDADHKPKPITSDSKDPNGSLILGLRAKKDLPKTMAFWELAIISQRFEDRRKTIYTELEPKTFKQILDACLAEIMAVKTRIDNVSAPPPPPPPSENDLAKERLKAGYANKYRYTDPLKNDDIFAPAEAPATGVARNLRAAGAFAKQHGKSGGPHPFAPIVNEELPKLIENATHRLPPPTAVQAWCQELLRSPLGAPFRQTFARRACAILLGTPHSQAATVVNAVTALTQLAVHSLKEDVYGVVNKDVATIIKTFVVVLAAVDKFVKSDLGVHWTDTPFSEQASREYRHLGDVREVVRALKSGLVIVLTQFETYLRGIEMTEKEIREARELVAAVKTGDEAE